MAVHFLQHLKDNIGKILGILQLKGSCNRFCKHHNMHINISSKVTSEDQSAANLFPVELLKINEVEEVFNTNETGHY